MATAQRQRVLADLRERVRHEKADGLGRERRREGAALVTPGPALADEQPLPEERAKDADGRWRAAVVLVIVDQDAANGTRGIQEKPGLTEEAALEDALF